MSNVPSPNFPMPQPGEQVHLHYNVKQYSNGVPITAMVLGLCTFVTFGATGIPALILGIIGLNQVKKGTASNSGAAWTGVALGALACIGWTLFWILGIIGSAQGS